MKRKVIIIGGGASGLAAAVCSAREGAAVTVVEHMDRVGKKLLSTGNGRCNITNQDMRPECYRCGQPSFPMEVINGFGVKQTLEFFGSLGIETKSRNGYIYPNSDQAGAVLDVLRQETEHLGVVTLTGCEAMGVEAAAGRPGLTVTTSQGRLQGEAVILAAGSRAAPATGSDGSGYELAKKLGHRVIKPLPALVQLRCQGKYYKQMAGIRTEAGLRLFAEDTCLAEDTGELQLTDYGLSGIPAFQISRFASRALDEGKRVRVMVDFLPAWTEGETVSRLKKRVEQLSYKRAEDLLVGVLNKKLAAVLVRTAGIDLSCPVAELGTKQLSRLGAQLRNYEALVLSVNPFANAQVCCGGADTRQVDPQTMESKICPGLYLAGELLDVDGICGGYNLQFAWSSGAIAGIHAAGGGSQKTGEGQ